MADDSNSDTSRPHDTVERTTIVQTERRGGGGALTAVILVIAFLALLYLFRDQLGFGSKDTTIKVPDKIELNIN